MFKLLSAAPKGEDLHYWLQRHVTRRLPRPAKQLASIDDMAGRFCDLYRAQKTRPLAETTFFEFGAGRDLAVLLGLSARGAGRCIAFDIEPLAKIDLIADTSRFLADRHKLRRAPVAQWGDLARDWNVEYRAPGDARDTRLPEQSIDCVISMDTLEHIPIGDIRLILKEARRIIRDDGVAVMKIDYGDHFAGFDSSITPFNFLKYSDAEWEPFQSRFQYVNRLRHSEYKQLFAEAGFEVVEEEPERRAVEHDIKGALADRFRRFDDDDLFTVGAIVVARPAKGQSRPAESRSRA